MKTISILIIIIITILNNFVYAESSLREYENSGIKAAVVIEVDSKRILFEKNSDEVLPMASLTKLMTSILLAENANLDDIVIVDEGVKWIGGSTLGLNGGEEITVKDLLAGMLLPSGNDCAYAAAIYIGGTIENFAQMMTDKARSLGCENTNFKNPHGLDEDGHSTTAYEMALITAHAFENEDIAKIMNTKSMSVKYGNTVKTINNTNRLLSSNQYCNGGKTGYTSAAEKCLATTASKGDFDIVTIVLGATDTDIRFDSSNNLINETFSQYEIVDLYELMNWYIKIPITKGVEKYYEKNMYGSLVIPLMKEELEKVYVKQNIITGYEAPLYKNTYLGDIGIYIGDEQIYHTDIYATNDILRKDPIYYFKDVFEIMRSSINKMDLFVM